MPVAHRRQANRAVVAEVLFVADPDQRLLQNQHHRRKYLLTRQTRSLQRRLRALANPRQLLGERQKPAVFPLVADVAPPRVIAILLPAARVAPDGLNMPARIRTNPDICPRRWNDQRLDSTEHGRILDRQLCGEEPALPDRMFAGSSGRKAELCHTLSAVIRRTRRWNVRYAHAHSDITASRLRNPMSQ